MAKPNMKIVIRDITELKEAKYNPRQLTKSQYKDLKESIERFGIVDPFIVNMHPKRKDIVIGGHQRLKVARDLKMKTVPTVEVSLDLQKERELNVRLNKNTGAWDFDILANNFEIPELLEWGFTNAELDIEPITPPDPPVEPATPEPPEIAKTKPGTIYKLGPHRLLCGDATIEKDVKLLMNGKKVDLCFTSPPYNVGKTPNGNKKKYLNDSDDVSTPEYLKFLLEFTKIAMSFCDYTFVNIQSLAGNKLALIQYLYQLRNVFSDYIIWDKANAEPAMARKVMNSRFEFIYVFSERAKRTIGTRDFRGDVENIININSRKGKKSAYMHKATFPVDLPFWVISTFCDNGSSVYDAFGGTGTTLIACEQTGRSCRMMEKEPAYCDVIVRRYCDMKGIKPGPVFKSKKSD